MEQHAHRLPLRSTRRIAARDAKLLHREDAVAAGLGNAALKRNCPCNVCITGVRDQELLRRTVHSHLRRYGRHPFHRGSTEVRNVPSLILLPRLFILLGKLWAILVLHKSSQFEDTMPKKDVEIAAALFSHQTGPTGVVPRP